MTDLRLLGKLYETEDGQILFIPHSNAVSNGEVGKIIKQPTPEDVSISKENKADYSLDATLSKHDPVSKKKV